MTVQREGLIFIVCTSSMRFGFIHGLSISLSQVAVLYFTILLLTNPLIQESETAMAFSGLVARLLILSLSLMLRRYLSHDTVKSGFTMLSFLVAAEAPGLILAASLW